MICVAAAAVACILTGLVRRHALSAGVLDVPNERSSHTRPTPRGGGLAMVVTILAGVAYLWQTSLVGQAFAIASFLGGGLVAIVGYIDDRRSLSAAVRFAAQLLAVVMLVAVLGPAKLPAATFPALPVAIALVVIVLGVCWWINLFNFMDGIDGIAASQAVFVAGSAAALTLWSGGSHEQSSPDLLVAAASLGFLVWNWPPARIFMGDVGSGFLGFMLSLLALTSSLQTSPVSIWTWLVLGCLFIADASVTLLRRMCRGERWYSAHRSHAYQQLARKWGSHGRVTIAFAVTNVAILLPLAAWSVAAPELAGFIALGALLIAFFAAIAAGAGRGDAATG